MKQSKYFLVLYPLLFLIAMPATGQLEKVEQDALVKGRPFLQLIEKIDQNYAAIEALQESIVSQLPEIPPIPDRSRWICPHWSASSSQTGTWVWIVNPHPTESRSIQVRFFDVEGNQPDDLYFEGTIKPFGTFLVRLLYRDEGSEVGWIHVNSDGQVYPGGDIRRFEVDTQGTTRTVATQSLTWYPLNVGGTVQDGQ